MIVIRGSATIVNGGTATIDNGGTATNNDRGNNNHDHGSTTKAQTTNTIARLLREMRSLVGPYQV